MKRAVILTVLTLFVGSLALTSLAEARAGGGGSSGSRGSRSFSAPRSPSAPYSPSSPASPSFPQRSVTPTPQRPGGVLGGMLGGLLVGGLLGSLLFGGLGHGGFGIGLLEILLVAGLGYLAFSFFRRRVPVPEMAGAPAGGGWAPTATAPGAGAPVLDPAVEDLARGVDHVRTMDAGFDPARFAEASRDVFVRVQVAWTARDLAPVRGELTEELAATLEADVARLRAQRRLNRLEKVTLDGAEVTEAWQESGRDFVTVRFRARGLDYTLDETTGAVVEGSSSVPTTFEEYWTFTRPVGPGAWRLSAIQQPV